MIIYLITNTINGKQYIGQTTQSLEKRWLSHVKAPKSHRWYLQRAIKKYGETAFSRCVLQTCQTQDELNVAEIAWIEKLNCLAPNGYNLREGGSRGRHSEATKQRIREIQNNRSPEWKAKLHAAIIKRNDRDDWKLKISQFRKGQKATEGQLRGLQVGRERWTEEERKKQAEANKGEGNANSKLTAEQVKQIREEYATGKYSQQKIGEKYGIKQITVSCIVTRKRWSHIN